MYYFNHNRNWVYDCDWRNKVHVGVKWISQRIGFKVRWVYDLSCLILVITIISMFCFYLHSSIDSSHRNCILKFHFYYNPINFDHCDPILEFCLSIHGSVDSCYCVHLEVSLISSRFYWLWWLQQHHWVLFINYSQFHLFGSLQPLSWVLFLFPWFHWFQLLW